jgi:putative copper resistance protein D
MITALLVITRAVHIGASILIAGTFTFYLVALGCAGWTVRNDLHEVQECFVCLAMWSLVAALISAVLWFWLEVANMSGLPLTDAFSTTAWQMVLFETKFGRIWQIRIVLGTVALVLMALGVPRGNVRRPPVLIVWSLSVAFLVSLAWISHAASASAQPLGLLGDALHLCAVSGWIGGLVPLAIFLTRVHASHSLGKMVAQVLCRFSALSLCCVSLIVASGISNSWLLVGSIYPLFATPYGRLLLFKLTLFAVLVGVGACNRFLVRVKLLKAPATPDLLPQLRRNVLCEVCLGVAVVAIVACLGVTPPARQL